MPIIRCSEQKNKTLKEFYTEFIPDKIKRFADAGTPMLNVLKLINDIFPQTTIYGLTSHATLLLLTEDNSLSQYYVALNGLEDEYYIHYLMTAEKQPWPNAMVKGTTKSLDELKRYLVIAMNESGGWSNNKELKGLYQQINSTITI
jgi:hypothetical protein